MQRLDLVNYRIQRVTTQGEAPPPHAGAMARLENDTIVVTWGTWGEHDRYQYALNIPQLRWERRSRPLT